MDSIQIRIVRSDGSVFETRKGGWTVEESKLENWDYFEQELTTSANVLTDGSSLVGKRLGEIDRTAYLVYLGNDKTLLEQQTEAKTFFNPKFTFRVYMTYNGRIRWVEGELDSFKCDLYKGLMITEIIFTLLCMDPYWRDSDENDRSLTDAEPMFGFPFVSILEDDGVLRGFNASRLIFDGKNTVYNSGDVPCTYAVHMEFDGEVKNPSITKDGKTIKILDTMIAGDVVEIDLQSAPPRLTKNGSNAIQLASRDSSFTGMEMQVGSNVFTYTMDNPENRSFMHVSILHNEKYMGV